MENAWVKVYLKNGQFEAVNSQSKNKEDHVYNYLINKYKNLFDMPKSPKRKPLKSFSKIRNKSNITLKNKFFNHMKPLCSQEKSCARCVLKYPSKILEQIQQTSLQPKKTKSVVFSKKKLSTSTTLGTKDIRSAILNNSYSTRPVSLSTFNKRAGFIRKPNETPIQDLLSSQRGLRA